MSSDNIREERRRLSRLRKEDVAKEKRNHVVELDALRETFGASQMKLQKKLDSSLKQIQTERLMRQRLSEDLQPKAENESLKVSEEKKKRRLAVQDQIDKCGND